jgi:hypothetical protein
LDQSKIEEEFQMLISIKNICQKNITRPEQQFKRPRHSFRSIISGNEADRHTNPTRKETEFG